MRVVTPNFHRKRIVESERRAHGKAKVGFIFAFHPLIHSSAITGDFLFQDGRERGAGVFGIDIYAPRQHGLLADVSSGQIEAAVDFQQRARLDHLSEKFAEHQRLGEVLGANYDAVCTRWRTRRNEQSDKNCKRRNSSPRMQSAAKQSVAIPFHRGCRRLSSHPKPKSAVSASTAAGIAPARMS